MSALAEALELLMLGEEDKAMELLDMLSHGDVVQIKYAAEWLAQLAEQGLTRKVRSNRAARVNERRLAVGMAFLAAVFVFVMLSMGHG
jgi:hypothetical protein